MTAVYVELYLELDSELIWILTFCFCAMVLFMNPFARCERLGPCRSKWERHFNQHVMLKLLITFSKGSQVSWLGSYWFLIIVWNIFSLLWCRIIHTCWLKRESLWNIWFADDCCTAAVINNFFWNSCIEIVSLLQSHAANPLLEQTGWL